MLLQANRGYFERALNFLGLGDSDMDYEVGLTYYKEEIFGQPFNL